MNGNPLTLHGLPTPLRFVINKLSSLDVLRRWYDDWLRAPEPGASRFLDYTLGRIGAQFDIVDEEALAALPQDKPLIIVANHPLGALEGMLLSRLLLRYRPDLKVLTNELLLHFKEFSDLFIGVDVLNPDKQQMNARGMMQASRHLAKGGALLIFPAGTVSVLDVKSWSIQDAPWKDIVGRLALKYKADCLPVHIEGRNGWSFYLSGLVHKRLRTLLLPRAMIAQHRKRVTARVGRLVSLAETTVTSPAAATEYLRLSCELLAGNPSSDMSSLPPTLNPLGEDIPGELLQARLDTLQEYRIAGQGQFQVYTIPFDALGIIADQLALERERTFRAVGEGTGRTLDRDRFDPWYWHILVWDSEAQRIAGAYRAARVSTVLQNKGVTGLYSNSLFQYDERFIQALGGAVEVGRSFVAAAYQSDSRALDLLWQGLGNMILRYPDCHTLFGCVSISSRYSPMLRAVLTDSFLAAHSVDDTMRSLVRPVSPFRYTRKFWTPDTLRALSSMAAINKLLGTTGTAQRVPVLIRHYLALNGKFIDFSVNRGFNHSLDGLILVDLRTAPARYLRRYLGRDGAEEFTQRWRHVS
ncbi:MAG: lysophospholipid acyltransferase family protein [Pseudomonadales bacterium]|nr:lysophospholipid acyltransferase family protein [Pseudomonadales bacterium]MCP5356919.1 lysophospholipid acyltransferase family protein [Pseudomonadales bacterium]